MNRSLPWALFAIALGANVLLGLCLRGASRRAAENAEAAALESARRQVAEQDALEEAGFGARLQTDNAKLTADLDALSARNGQLADQLAALEARVGKGRLRPIRVSSGTTGPCDCSGEPRVPGALEGGGQCLLADGDQGEIAIDEAELQTDAGTLVLVGAASAYRSVPEPASRLFSGPVEYRLAEAERIVVCPPPEIPRWCAPAWSLALSAAAGTLLTAGIVAAVR